MNKALYGVWAGMKQRCHNPRCKVFPHYGGRGIIVAEPWCWPNGYQHFETWAMAHGYRSGLTINRINNDGPYAPDNCEWVTRAQNLKGRRMTPAWRAAIAKMRASPRVYTMTPNRLAACRANMAKAREAELLRRKMLHRYQSHGKKDA